MAYEYVPDRPLDPPEDDRPAVYTCKECGEDIKDGDGYSRLGENYFCDRCIEDNHSYAEDWGGYDG